MNKEQSEDLIWCKQSILRVIAFCSLQNNAFLDELHAELNDVETGEYSEDAKAIEHAIKMIESYKDGPKN